MNLNKTKTATALCQKLEIQAEWPILHESYRRAGLRNLATWWDEATRYQQIKRYAGRAGLSNWVAIDDQPEGWGADDLDKLVHTNCETGLSDPAALALLAARLEGLRKPEPC